MSRTFLEQFDLQTQTKIISEAFALLEDPGVRILNNQVLDLLGQAGAAVDLARQVASIPEKVIRGALQHSPASFALYTAQGEAAIHYGGRESFYAPASAALYVLDRESQQIRLGQTGDVISFCQAVEMLDQIQGQSTAIVPADVPQEIADLYRLYLVLSYSSKPVVTGAFQKGTCQVMIDLLAAAANGVENLAKKPRAIFDVCPTSPLSWSETASQNLLDCVRAGIPVQIVPMPLAGATSPVTLAGTVVQHAAECLSGIVIAQTAKPGAPVVWGGSPGIFDMKSATAPLGAGESWLLGIAYAQIGGALGLPTQSFLGISDAKTLDAQAGLESASMILAALAGVHLITGAGMLALENCQSLEKLAFDAELIHLAQRLVRGITVRDDPIALDLLREAGHQAEFLSHPHTLAWYREEADFPSPIIDRRLPPAWQRAGSLTARQQANHQLDRLLDSYRPPDLDPAIQGELRRLTARSAAEAGLAELPPLPPE